MSKPFKPEDFSIMLDSLKFPHSKDIVERARHLTTPEALVKLIELKGYDQKYDQVIADAICDVMKGIICMVSDMSFQVINKTIPHDKTDVPQCIEEVEARADAITALQVIFHRLLNEHLSLYNEFLAVYTCTSQIMETEQVKKMVEASHGEIIQHEELPKGATVH